MQDKVSSVTFTLSTVPTTWPGDIVNNYFKIQYIKTPYNEEPNLVNSVAVKDSTSGRTFQVINPGGKNVWYFCFTACATTGGIETTIEEVFFDKGPYITSANPDKIVAHK